MLTILAVSYLLLFVLFGQSSVDKIINWNENYTWLKDYFSKTIFNRFTKLNLLIITCLELASALLSIYSFILIVSSFIRVNWLELGLSGWEVSYITNIVCSITLLLLFTGQRIAKDYLGAVRIIPYFILVIVLSVIVYMKFY